ncbi:MAG: DUF4404 family protein [Gammaproteobacteria bacterium]|jgi:hypothetical protein
MNEQEKQELQALLEKLQKQAEAFEVTHPELVDTINRLCVMLANMGI